MRFSKFSFRNTEEKRRFSANCKFQTFTNFIRHEHFKMKGLETVKSLVRKGDWLVKLDLKDACITVPILPTQKNLTFCLEKTNLSVSCLPFGLCSAPRLFTKLMKVVVGFLRERGLRLVVYLEDLLLLNENEAASRTI